MYLFPIRLVSIVTLSPRPCARQVSVVTLHPLSLRLAYLCCDYAPVPVPGRCPPGSVFRLAASTQRLSLRLCAGPQRPLAAGLGQLPNSPLRSGHSAAAARAQRTCDVITTAPGDVTAPQVTDDDVTACDVTSREVAAMKTSALTSVQPKRGGASEATTKKKKTKVKKVKKLKPKLKVQK